MRLYGSHDQPSTKPASNAHHDVRDIIKQCEGILMPFSMKNCRAPLRRALLFAMVCAGCNPDGPGTSDVQITVTTLGAAEDQDPDGYLLVGDGGDSDTYSLPIQGIVTIPAVTRGSHVFLIQGLAVNCSIVGGNSIAIEVGGNGSVTAVSVSVSCVPKTGSIAITAVTSGSDLDPDGYTVGVGSLASTVLSPNATRVISGVREGQHLVTITGLSFNCAVSGPSTRPVIVTFGATAEVSFTIVCNSVGAVRVTTTTTGDAVDLNGYVIELMPLAGSASRRAVVRNGEVIFPGLAPRAYTLSVFDLAPNCDPVIPSPRTIPVSAGIVTEVNVTVDCTVPTTIAVAVETTLGNAEIFTIRSDGSSLNQLTFDNRADFEAAWSPDRNRIAFVSERDGNAEIYIMKADGQNPIRLTTNSAADRDPSWSPDGERIVFQSNRDGNEEIYVMTADGANQARLTNHIAGDVSPAWSPDGNKIAFASERAGSFNIYLMKPDGSEVTRVTTSSLSDAQPAWSPDGRRIAYVSARSNQLNGIVIINSDGSEPSLITGQYEDASSPAWSPDGRKIAARVKSCVSDYYYYYNYCDKELDIRDVTGMPYWSRITGNRIWGVAWR